MAMLKSKAGKAAQAGRTQNKAARRIAQPAKPAEDKLGFLERYRPVRFSQSGWKGSKFAGKQTLLAFLKAVEDSVREGKPVEDKIDREAQQQGFAGYVHRFQDFQKAIVKPIQVIIDIINGLRGNWDTQIQDESKDAKGTFDRFYNRAKAAIHGASNVVRVQGLNYQQLKNTLAANYSYLIGACDTYLKNSSGIGERNMLIDSPHSFHRISAVKEFREILRRSLNDVRNNKVIDPTPRNSGFYPNKLTS